MDTKPEPFKIEVDAAEPAGAEESGFLAGALQGQLRPNIPDLDALGYVKQLLQQIVRSCRLYVDGNPRGTGFLVGPDLVLTSRHVLEEADGGQFNLVPARSITVSLAELEGLDTSQARREVAAIAILADRPPSEAERNGDPRNFAPGASDLDYALVQLGENVGQSPTGLLIERGWVDLRRARKTNVTGAPLVVCHHPNGRVIVSINTEPAAKDLHGGLRLEHKNNTRHGSSGALVSVLKDGLPVALHQFGGTGGIENVNNHAVPLHLVRDDIYSSFEGARALLENLPAQDERWRVPPTPQEIDERAAYIYKWAHDKLHRGYEFYQAFCVKDSILQPRDGTSPVSTLKNASALVRAQCNALDVFAREMGYDGAASLDPLIVELLAQLDEAERAANDVAGLPEAERSQAGTVCIEVLIRLFASVFQVMRGLDARIEDSVDSNDSWGASVTDLARMHTLWGQAMTELDVAHANWLSWAKDGYLRGTLEGLMQQPRWDMGQVDGFSSPRVALEQLWATYEAEVNLVDQDLSPTVLQCIVADLSRQYGIVDDELLRILRQK